MFVGFVSLCGSFVGFHIWGSSISTSIINVFVRILERDDGGRDYIACELPCVF